MRFSILLAAFFSSAVHCADAKAQGEKPTSGGVVIVRENEISKNDLQLCKELAQILSRTDNQSVFGVRTESTDIIYPKSKNFESINWQTISIVDARNLFPRRLFGQAFSS